MSHLGSSEGIGDARIGSTAAVTVIREGNRVELKIPITSTSTSN